MKKIFFLILLLFPAITIYAQKKARNLIIITTDGLRWQELFNGVDKSIANHGDFNQDSEDAIYSTYWDKDVEKSREKLLPFIWGTIRKKGQIYGNRAYENKVNVSNSSNISFPGYSEIFTGFVDKKIRSNDFKNNPNTNVLEFINKQRQYKGRVAVFGAWGAFPYIFNRDRNSMPVFASFDTIGGKKPTELEKLINGMLQNSFRPWGNGECLDVFTHYAAMEYLKDKKPKVLYISYGETDEWAHAGKYKYYLNAAHQFDKFVQQIWNWIQKHPTYKDNTTLLITTDHGRGDRNKREWTSHGAGIVESGEIWLAVMGPEIKAKGEIKTSMQLYQQQIAQTIATLLNLTFTAEHPVAEKILPVFD